jgi:4'-phosphopantetheinyl transferase
VSARATWAAAPAELSLDHGEVHIWRVNLDRPQPEVAALERHLSPDELERAARFRFARDRRRYVVARGVLRALLGRVLSIRAIDVCLQYGAQGKPALAHAHDSDVQFNLAHSHELALIALACGAALGVDVEYQRELDDAERLARRFFSAQEVAALLAAPAAQRKTTFFRIWTRKEAFIKATGKGLSQPLGAFNVMSPGGNVLSHVELEGKETRWRLRDLSPDPAYGAALVVGPEGSASRLIQVQY